MNANELSDRMQQVHDLLEFCNQHKFNVYLGLAEYRQQVFEMTLAIEEDDESLNITVNTVALFRHFSSIINEKSNASFNERNSVDDECSTWSWE